jgi:pimeloyl-ACP methyl ester carboxylesterase
MLLLTLATGALGHNLWTNWQLREPGFHEQNCWFYTTAPGSARCGIFAARENRRDPDSRVIEMPVVIFETSRQKERKEPILFLTGGPGEPAYLDSQRDISWWAAVRELFPDDHDLIVLGQRGTGLQEFDIDCPELLESEERSETSTTFDRTAERKTDLQSCAARLQKDGVDLTAYNSRESAADIAELRTALGVEEWTLYGVSYGSRLALSTLRYHPEGIRAVILDSVVPPEVKWRLDAADSFVDALEQVFQDCATHTGCTQQYGDLAESYKLATAALAREGLAISLSDLLGDQERVFHIGGQPVHYRPNNVPKDNAPVVTLGAELFNKLLREKLLTSKGREAIPVLIREAAEQRPPVVRAQLRDYLFEAAKNSISTAVYLSHICHDEVPFVSAEELGEARSEAGILAYVLGENGADSDCSLWPSGKADIVEDTPVESGVPTLLLAGRYDPLTPPKHARDAANHLSNGYFFELADAGHGVLQESSCARYLVDEFLKTLERPDEAFCRRKGRLKLFYP